MLKRNTIEKTTIIMVLLLSGIVVKGAPMLGAARCHPSVPRLKVGDAPSQRRRIGEQGATRSLDSPPARYALFLFLLFFSRCQVAEGWG